MRKEYIWTKSKARLLFIKAKPQADYNWLFLPGGPGLGSESLKPLTALLDLPGTIWHLDLPGDGSNHTRDDTHSFSQWSKALLEAVKALDKVILVAHSTGGMYAQATPALEEHLRGLVLMDSAPDASWQKIFIQEVEGHPIAGALLLNEEYAKNPNNQTLKELTLLSAPYLFTEAGLKKDISFLESLPYNYQSCDWSATHFDQSYVGAWIPKTIPTLIFAGSQDRITPLSLFQESQAFQRDNIIICEVPNAGHFPWIDNPAHVREVFSNYCGFLAQHEHRPC